jgi:hypothetical protein
MRQLALRLALLLLLLGGYCHAHCGALYCVTCAQ